MKNCSKCVADFSAASASNPPAPRGVQLQGCTSVSSSIPYKKRHAACRTSDHSAVSCFQRLVRAMLPQVSILIADSCPLIRWSLVQALAGRCQVGEAPSAEQALSELNSRSYDLLVLGCGSCGPSCSVLARQAKQIQPALQIILLGNMPVEYAECDCHRVDIRCFYEKPFDLNDLVNEILGAAQDKTPATAAACRLKHDPSASLALSAKHTAPKCREG